MRHLSAHRALLSLSALCFVGAGLVCCRISRPAGPSEAEVTRALTSYAEIAAASYSDAQLAARALVDAIDALVAQPSEERLRHARDAWLAARVPYAQTEVFRFYDGPIDAVEVLVNTWPIDETYLEAQDSAASPGIIENVTAYPEITRDLLVALNGKAGETSIATGYHVIEFLLWGQDTHRDGPGTRPYTDYLPAPNESPALSHASRRGRYLKLASELLAEQLTSVATAWRDQPGSYRRAFLGRPAHEALALVFKGMGSLAGAELSGERLTVAYETKNQENEHSCFSDTTHLDLANNAQGISNVCQGQYRKTDQTQLAGFGVCALVERYDSALGKALATDIASSVHALRAIPAPFDTAILGSDDAPSRRSIARAIDSLQTQTQTLTRAAAVMQLAGPPVAQRASR